MTNDYDKPTEVSDIFLAFPANLGDLIPPSDHIPIQFWDSSNQWNQLASAWFMDGLKPEAKFILEDEVDGNIAVRHISAILKSYEPKHEHKIAATAYLSSIWFKEVFDYR